MKKYNISRLAAIFFLACLVITIRYFEAEAATFLLIAAIGSFVSSIIYFKLNR